jgi:hypothetical protein
MLLELLLQPLLLPWWYCLQSEHITSLLGSAGLRSANLASYVP